MMPKKLLLYNKKRDFKVTSEPPGKVARSESGFSYLIQKHEATRLHYDFRIELDGVLKSWAVTRGPSFDPADKRLAVEVEDHPLHYGSFEGIIPKGEYGGGTVMLWDRGTWEPIGNPHEGLKKGHLSFILHGERLKGEWSLLLIRGKNEKRRNWLLVKKTDKFAKPGDNDKFLLKNDSSIGSKRKMADIAAAKITTAKIKKAKPPKPKFAKKIKSKLPDFIEPQLATLSDAMPTGSSWVHEVKFDGYRVQAHIENGAVKMITRNGKDWTDKFHTLADELSKLDDSLIIDGEIVALDKTGNSSFMELQQALSDENDINLQYYAFDLLHFNEKDLRPLPLVERKERLKQIIEGADLNNIYFSEHFFSDDGGFYKQACSLNLEGVISKLADEPYTSGRSKSWLKSKCHQRQEFVIGGYTLQNNATKNLGALLVGVYEGEAFKYCGRVGTGFNNKTSMLLLKKLKKLKQQNCPFTEPPKSKNRYGIIWVKPKSGGTWVKPELVCEVEFGEWTRDNILRHPSFQGLREDKKPKQIKHEIAVSAQKIIHPEGNLKSNKSESVNIKSINITHPGRIVYPALEITKQALAEYYVGIEDLIMPHLVNRPLSILRCQEGFGGACFFQRHLTHGHIDKNIKEIELKTKEGQRHPFLTVDNIKGVITLVQMGVLEIHPWGSTADDLDKPDRVIFDLDPDLEVEWQKVIDGAFEIKQRMDEFGLESFVKTTGGKGLHVVVPMKPKYSWQTISDFTKAIAESMENDNPEVYIANMSKNKRYGKIFIDYHRNKRSATAVSAYSSRAREQATVSMPIAWKTLNKKLDPQKFNILISNKKISDPWNGFFKSTQTINPKILKHLQIKY